MPRPEPVAHRNPPTTSLASLADEIHVYRLDLAQCRQAQDLLEPARRSLDPQEQARASRITHPQARQDFIHVRAALRTLLGKYLDESPKHLRFTTGEKGKPRLQGSRVDEGLVFNVSHSHDYGLIALAVDTALGVDVERRRDIAHLPGMAARCLTPGELAYWQALPPSAQPAAFFEFWTNKEAFLKATGIGLSLGLDACSVDLTGTARLSAVPSGWGEPSDWRLSTLPMPPDYHAALCHLGPGVRQLRLADEPEWVSRLSKLGGTEPAILILAQSPR